MPTAITSSGITFDDATTQTTAGLPNNGTAITGRTQLADPLASGDEFLVHDTSASALRRVAWSSLQPTGTILQTQYEQVVTLKTVSWTTTWGDADLETSLPSSTAGAEIVAKSIQPTSASNVIQVSINIPALTVSATDYHRFVVFRNTTAVQGETTYVYANRLDQGTTYGRCNLSFIDSPNTTSAVTYSVRIAAQAAGQSGSANINGSGSPIVLVGGGMYKASLILQEIKG